MASAKKCDVCKKLFTSGFFVPDIAIVIYRHPYGDHRIDLCPECQKKLEKFVEGCDKALETKGRS